MNKTPLIPEMRILRNNSDFKYTFVVALGDNKYDFWDHINRFSKISASWVDAHRCPLGYIVITRRDYTILKGVVIRTAGANRMCLVGTSKLPPDLKNLTTPSAGHTHLYVGDFKAGDRIEFYTSEPLRIPQPE